MNSKSTPQKILEAAVRLYGERGADAVGMRELARAVRVMPNTITYHFGSKENLRRQALSLALEKAGTLDDVVALHPPQLTQDPQEQANQVGMVVMEFCGKIFLSCSEYCARMITYGLIGADDEQKKLLVESLKRLKEAWGNYLGTLGLNLDTEQLRNFCYYLWSQTLFLAASQDLMRMDQGTETLSPEFLTSSAKEVARTCCVLLRLPEPVVHLDS